MGDQPLPGLVERSDTAILFKRATDDQSSITQAWTDLETAIGSLRGRRFYGTFDPATREYRACVEVRDDDDPGALGLEPGILPGGRFVRERLQGEPPAVYALIAPTLERLAERPDADPARPSIEFYRRRDVIELLQPVS
ncbi:MAG: hypothetical protein ACJ764_08955 [Solirubrobacteraceae bacterium]